MSTPTVSHVEGAIGQSPKRIEDDRFIRGKGTYVDDVQLPGMLFMSIYRSPFAHATINSIDTSRAMAMPGVLACITGKDLDYVNFQKFLSESYRPPPEGTSDFQKPVGLAVRRFCAPLLDLEKGVSGEDYVRRRQELGPDEVNRRLMRACGLSHLLIDTGHRASVILDVPDMAKVANVPTFEVVRIEALAEEVMRGGVSADAFPTVFAETLRARARDAVGLKTIVAYRTTFAIDYSRPSHEAVAQAAGQWMKRSDSSGKWRLDDSTIIRHLL